MRLFSTLGLVIFLCLAGIMPGTSNTDTVPGCEAAEVEGTRAYQEVNISGARNMINTLAELFILDVQDNVDYREGHIRNAHPIPLDQLLENLDIIPRSIPVLVYGDGKYQAISASENLSNNGYDNIHALCCGIDGWKLEGYPAYIQYPVLNEAIRSASAGGTIYLGQGIYDGPITIEKSLNIQGENASNTIVKNQKLNIDHDNVNIANLGFQGGEMGIEAMGVNNISITNCSFANSRIAMELSSTSNVLLSGNMMEGCGVVLRGELERHWNSHVIETTNTVSELPVRYYSDVEGAVLPGNVGEKAGQIILANCTNITLQNMTLAPGSVGIALGFSSQNKIKNNTLQGNSQAGIKLHKSEHNIVSSNVIEQGGKYGILVDKSPNNVIKTNIVKDNLLHGITVIEGSNNVIFNNSLIRNNGGEREGFDQGQYTEWSSDGRGNYWSNYRARYPLATNNGVYWSEPYELDGTAGGVDSHPLVWPVNTIGNGPMADAGVNLVADQHANIMLNGSLSHAWGEDINHTWTFQYNGTSVTILGEKPTFTFHLAGEYDILLNVSDNQGRSDSDVVQVTIIDTEKPVARVECDRTVNQNDMVILNGTGSSDNNAIVNYTWTFEDGGGKTLHLHGAITSHIFANAGKFMVTLVVKDEKENQGETTVTITVRDTQPPNANGVKDMETVPGETIILSGGQCQDNVGITNYSWTLSGGEGNNITLYGREKDHNFERAGRYEVTLRLMDGAGNIFGMKFNITVKDVTPPHMSIFNHISGRVGEKIMLSGGNCSDDTGVVNYTWNITAGDKIIILFGETVSLEFQYPGNYTGTLRARDDAGNQNITQFYVRIGEGPKKDSPGGCGRFELTLLFIASMVAFICIVMSSICFHIARKKWRGGSG